MKDGSIRGYVGDKFSIKYLKKEKNHNPMKNFDDKIIKKIFFKKRYAGKILDRACSVCGEKLRISVSGNGRYDGGNYFGNICTNSDKTGKYFFKIPDKNGRLDWDNKIKEINKNYDPKVRKEYSEYWECD